MADFFENSTLEALAIKLAGQQSSISAARITLFTISSKKAAIFFGEALARKITEKITGRLIGFFVSSVLFSKKTATN
ncbi:hypothetical protein L2Y01_24720 [Pseudomonas avellanae]|nr:hypothetical protein [Pseudomonas avellanae]UQW73849.1 hypothetical protein L2Y01_24720 [Pseudomonas avellanae]